MNTKTHRILWPSGRNANGERRWEVVCGRVVDNGFATTAPDKVDCGQCRRFQDVKRVQQVLETNQEATR